jgi:hypothetical protein
MQMSGSSFRTGEPDLTKLLEQIHNGELQLPDFQRGWVWDDSHIRSLIASITRSFPIGSVMLLETGGDGIRFKPRVVQGAPEGGVEPKLLILDGQQRMTSLYLALRSGKPVPTQTEQGKDVERFYYFDISACLDPTSDREDAIISVPADRVVRTNFNREVVLDLSNPEQEYAQQYFPVSALFGDRWYEWCRGYRSYHQSDPDKTRELDAFDEEIADRFRKYRVPAIELTRATSKEAVCLVFEKVNTGGVALTVFELMTATFASDDFDLRKDWEHRKANLNKNAVLQTIEATDFLQAVTLLASYERTRSAGTPTSCKRKDILNLALGEYQDGAVRIEQGLENASRLLVREKIFHAYNLPYKSQLVPLSAICAVLGDRFDSDSVKQKLARWYWCGVFGELYGGTTETRFSRDIAEVLAWIDGGERPKTVGDANLAPTRLLTLQSRQSAAYKGMMALLMQAGSKDLINGDEMAVTTFFEEAVDIHHVFPKKHCTAEGYPRQKWNSIVNKTPLTARTNRSVGGHAPSKYLGTIEAKHGIDPGRLDEILSTHLINPLLLRTDDFDRFICDRARRLLDLIEDAIGKAVVGRDAEDVVKAFGGSLTSMRHGTSRPSYPPPSLVPQDEAA